MNRHSGSHAQVRAEMCTPSNAQSNLIRHPWSAPRCAALALALGLGLGLLFALPFAAFPAAAQSTTATATSSPSPAAPESVSHGLFTDVKLHRPAGTVQQFVLLLSAEPESSVADRQRVQAMLAAGAMVAVVQLEPFYRRLAAQDGQCTYAGGAFENLSRHLQAYAKLPGYLLPMLVGSGAGATFAYAMLAQTPPGTFASALSAGFCPRLALSPPMCAANALQWRPAPAPARGVDLLPAKALPAAWSAAAGRSDAACIAANAEAFVRSVPGARWMPAGPEVGTGNRAGSSATNSATHAATNAATHAAINSAGNPADTAADRAAFAAFTAAYATLAVKQAVLAPPPAQLADLPLVEAPSSGAGKRFAVLLSGDGGWAAIDKGLAAAFAAKDLPVVGLDSLRYFWTARTPDGLASDLDRIVRFYAARWKRSEVVLIGYSQGADVLPFAINRLPPATRASVRMTVLLGLGQKASFEFHLANWIGPSGDRPIAPEARKLSAADTLCFYGLEDRGSLCPQLAPLHVRALGLPGDHHFGGDYPALAARILGALPR